MHLYTTTGSTIYGKNLIATLSYQCADNLLIIYTFYAFHFVRIDNVQLDKRSRPTQINLKTKKNL